MKKIGLLLVLGAGACMAVAQSSGGDSKQQPGATHAPGVKQPAPREDRERPNLTRTGPADLLELRFSAVDLNEVSLREAFEWLAETTHTNVVVRWDMLETAGVTDDATVSVRARNLRLGQVLWMMLNQASGGEERLAYRVSRDMILISTLADLSQEMIVRAYDVTDIVATELAVPEIGVGRDHAIPLITGIATGPGAVGADAGVEIVRSGVRLRGSNPLGQDEDERDVGDGGFANRMAELVDVITATVEPESWDVNGGNGTIRVYRGLIIVRNSPFVHQQLGGPIRE